MSGQPEMPVETVREWLRYAEEDLGVAGRELVDDGALLNEYIVSGRYPGDLAFEEIDQPEAEEALGALRRIHARVTTLLKMSPGEAE